MPATQRDTTPRAFFRAVHRTFQGARRSTGYNPVRFFKIAGHTIRLQFAGNSLVPLITPALKHLATEPTDDPALTVCLWDSRSTGVPVPNPYWPLVEPIPPLKEEGDHNRVQTFLHRGDNILVSHRVGVGLSLFDNSRNLALYWTSDFSEVLYHIRVHPLRSILHWWMRDNGYYMIHAGAVGTPDGGLLLVGKSGTGKSTTALACIASELKYVSDDYCLLSTAPAPYAHSIFSSATLEPSDVEKCPHLEPIVENKNQLHREKAILFLHEHHPEKIAPGFPIRAVLLPRITGRSNTLLTPVPAMEAMKMLAPSSILQLPGANQAAFRAMAGLVRRVPCYNLELGTDPKEIPPVISRLLFEGYR